MADAIRDNLCNSWTVKKRMRMPISVIRVNSWTVTRSRMPVVDLE